MIYVSAYTDVLSTENNRKDESRNICSCSVGVALIRESASPCADYSSLQRDQR